MFLIKTIDESASETKAHRLALRMHGAIKCADEPEHANDLHREFIDRNKANDVE